MKACLPIVFRKGTAIDDILDPSISISLTSYNIDDWCFAIDKAFNLSKDEIFIESLRNRLTNLQTWEKSAHDLKKLYNELK